MRPDKSVPLLEAIHSDIQAGDDRRDWVMELDRRTQSFLALLRAGDIEVANQQLEQSRRETAAALKIADSLAF